MKKTIWIVYDLGIQGDYEGIYSWLDEKKAKECGDSTAMLHFEYKNDIANELKNELSEAVKISKKTRIYVIWRDDNTQKMKGKFIFGSRQASPWTGYANTNGSVEDLEL